MITNNLHVIAAICGNFYQESTVNPGIWENLTPNASGYGLGQWTDNSQVSRRTALFNWLDANNYSHDDGIGQLKFLLYENVWNVLGANGLNSIYSNLAAYLTTTETNIDFLTMEFMYHWEGISDETEQVRIQFAYDAYNFMISGETYRERWFIGNEYNSRNEALWNSLRIMDFFLEEEPEPTEEEILAIVRTALRRRRKGGGIIVF